MDKKNIDLFKIARPKDINLNYAISDTEGVTDLFFYHKSSPINTLDKQVSSYQKAAVTEIKKVKTFTLNYILNKLNFDQQIDYMNLDVEGLELKVINGFDIDRYKPKVISVEYLDLDMKKLEFKNNHIENLMSSKIYKYFVNNDYFFVNWLHGDLIFVHKNFRD